MFRTKKSKSIALTIALLTPPVIIGGGLIGFDQFDPYYKTENFISATITRLVYATGKSGSGVKVTVKATDGKEHQFDKSVYFKGKNGDIVRLRIYERQYTGLQRYRLER